MELWPRELGAPSLHGFLPARAEGEQAVRTRGDGGVIGKVGRALIHHPVRHALPALSWASPRGDGEYILDADVHAQGVKHSHEGTSRVRVVRSRLRRIAL